MEQINLITPYYDTGDGQRQRELDRCLEKNSANPLLDRIVLLIDDGSTPPIKPEKLSIKRMTRRPTYLDWLTTIEEQKLQGSVILANSDIYFDRTIASIHEVLKGPQSFMALSRGEVSGNQVSKHPNPHWSQDSWALRADSLFSQELKNKLNVCLGVPRCDNKVAYIFAISGWSIRNPCDLIKSYHLHETGKRSYSKRGDISVTGGVAYVYPMGATDQDSALHYDVWSIKSQNVVQVTVNNSLEKWRMESEKDVSGSENQTKPLAAAHRSKTGTGTGTGTNESKLELYRSGKRIYEGKAGGAILESDHSLLIKPDFNPRNWTVLGKKDLDTDYLSSELALLFKPVLDFHLESITDRPETEHDVNFWQYPCITEKQAWKNHCALADPCIDIELRKIKIYVPLPWATYIDNRNFPPAVLDPIAQRIALLKALAHRFGYELETHTVCQHIRWALTLGHAKEIGITDLHISHCTASSSQEVADAGLEMRVHPWSLFAVNYGDKSRSEGLTVGKSMQDRKLLASFIGAHMGHYRSDIRLRVCEGLASLNRDDILVDLTNLWHFNQVVYDHQVKEKHLDKTIPIDLRQSTRRYNVVLSDSRFSLCPEGAGVNTLRLWESIAVGSIPVLFNRDLAVPKRIRAKLNELCYFWTEPFCGIALYDQLKKEPLDELQQRSDQLRRLYKEIENLTCF